MPRFTPDYGLHNRINIIDQQLSNINYAQIFDFFNTMLSSECSSLKFQAACHKDPVISKMAVTCIHDIMTTLLNENSELEHFHFNEALFKPFENLLCLELCDTDVQDQV